MLPIYTAMKLNAAALDLFATGLRSAETMLAADAVIRTRSRMIGDAAAAPHKGDYRELSRMVPEKVAAFGAAGDVLAAEWRIWQQEVGALAATAEPTIDTFFRWTDAMTRLWAAPGAALRPVHAAATANARRLGKRTRRR
ncbi:hypothetical protein [Sphingosinicella sp. BN140058]|uniref:hypothetical protein n=1 Tax=Sphingosinicella sp. BN140058 TaxID=1892855 RepID=UPI001013A9E4|nr:hypothetical protein [Sphingosinicella sp. BN140058]QAY75867.1 hypothetical protein ETR14_04470 [Sphingosinicella sp. BN140058]